MSTEEQRKNEAYEEWINSFSGLGGRSTISKEETPVRTVELSEFVRVYKEPIGWIDDEE